MLIAIAIVQGLCLGLFRDALLGGVSRTKFLKRKSSFLFFLISENFGKIS